MTCQLHSIPLFSKSVFRTPQKFTKDEEIFTQKSWFLLINEHWKTVSRKKKHKKPWKLTFFFFFCQSHCSYKFNFELSVQQGFNNNRLIKWISGYHQELWIVRESQLPFFSCPRFVSAEHHHRAPLSAPTFRGVIIVFWYISIYACKIMQYPAGTRDQILEVE